MKSFTKDEYSWIFVYLFVMLIASYSCFNNKHLAKMVQFSNCTVHNMPWVMMAKLVKITKCHLSIHRNVPNPVSLFISEELLNFNKALCKFEFARISGSIVSFCVNAFCEWFECGCVIDWEPHDSKREKKPNEKLKSRTTPLWSTRTACIASIKMKWWFAVDWHN